jgi:hypothetical protein
MAGELQGAVIEDSLALLLIVTTREWRFAMCQLVQQHPETPYVQLIIVRLVADHLGRHVLNSPTITVALYLACIRRPAKIANLDVPELVEQQVFRLFVRRESVPSNLDG